MKSSLHPLSAPAVLSLLTALLGCTVDQEQAQSDKKIVPVQTVAATQTDIAKSTQQPATVYPYFETAIRPRVSGYVTEIAVDIGDVVKAGQLLAKIDVPELEQQRETLAAQIGLFAAEEEDAKAGVSLSEAALQSAVAKSMEAESQLASVEASLAAAEAEFKRTEDLVNRGSLQSRMLDEARKKRDSAIAAKEAVNSAVTASRAEIGVAEAEKSAAQAKLRIAKAKTEVALSQLKELEVTLNFAQVTAPFDGVVTHRHVNLGDLLDGQADGSSMSLFTLSKTDIVRIQVPVPESDAPFVQPGDTLTLTFPSFASEPPIKATITRIAGSLAPSSRTMTVEAEIENASGKLLPGMFGQAKIDLETKIAMTVLPSRAVRFDESGRAYVYLLNDNDRVSLKDVEIGTDTGTQIEILSGVQPGDIVVGPHLKRFGEGQLVKPL